MKREFNKYVQSLSEKELKAELKMLFDKFEMVKKYYEMDLGSDSGRILEDYKEKIKKEYFPNRGYGNGRSSFSRKVVSDFRKIAVHQSDFLDVV
ncbi:MAG: hypothetical protein KTR26_04310 [Flammeovirgaceae bacterium]|nr:hypothetical protein [Flammeovirgaceae bacterium]